MSDISNSYRVLSFLSNLFSAVVPSIGVTNTLLAYFVYRITGFLDTMSHRNTPSLSRMSSLIGGSLGVARQSPNPTPRDQALEEILQKVRKMEQDIAEIKLRVAQPPQLTATAPSNVPPPYTSRLYPQIKATPYD